jgi:hypothetical protein
MALALATAHFLDARDKNTLIPMISFTFPTSRRRRVPAKNTSEHLFDYCPYLAYMLGSD